MKASNLMYRVRVLADVRNSDGTQRHPHVVCTHPDVLNTHCYTSKGAEGLGGSLHDGRRPK